VVVLGITFNILEYSTSRGWGIAPLHHVQDPALQKKKKKGKRNNLIQLK
jgi:hypothetical protein